MSSTLEFLEARKTIEEVDAEMVKLFERRMQAVEVIAAHKLDQNLPINDPQREFQLISRNLTLVQNLQYKALCERFFTQLITISKLLQHDKMYELWIAKQKEPGKDEDNQDS